MDILKTNRTEQEGDWRMILKKHNGFGYAQLVLLLVK